LPKKFTTDNCWVVIAAYNEEKHILAVVKKVLAQGFSHVIVANDGSRDKTAELAEKTTAIVLSHITNLGKGAVMKTGADYAFANSAKAVIFMDGDGQHDPSELGLFVNALNKGNQIVFGCRRQTKKMPFVRKLGKMLTHTTVKLFYNLDLEDVLSGYRALTKEAYAIVRWDSRDYRVESEMIARAGRNNLKYTQFEIATIYHDNYKGVNIFDGIKMLFYLVWWRMRH
jgi:glycosyltransferase involved in cell wall biosynthesis